MLSMQMASVVLAVAGVGDNVLLDFTATWCGPCRTMEPVMAQLSAAGYPVRKVDIDREPELAARYRVSSIPCFVLLVNGQEVNRTVGAMDRAQLESMLTTAGIRAGSAQVARGQSPPRRLLPGLRNRFGGGGRTFGAQPPTTADPFAGYTSPAAQPAMNTGPVPAAKLIEASARLTIEDEGGFSYGSGTVIDARSGEALILTCGHVFRDSKGKGRITVDLFGVGAPKKIPGHLVSYDIDREIGLVSVRPGRPVTVARLAPRSRLVSRGEKVVSVGCNNGDDPTALESQVTSVNKFGGPENLQVAGQPVQGRSGGGLFTSDGLVIGVCNAADPADNEGVYAALPEVYAQLELAKLTALFEQPGAPATDRQMAAVATPQTKQQSDAEQPLVPVPTDLRVVGDGSRQSPAELTAAEVAAVTSMGKKADRAEVICIVRSLDEPTTKSEVFVLDRASPQFLKQLATERSVQPSANLTSLDVPRAKGFERAYAGSTRGATGDRSRQPRPLTPR